MRYCVVSTNNAYNVIANLRNEAGTVGIKNVKQVPYKLFFLKASKRGHQLNENVDMENSLLLMSLRTAFFWFPYYLYKLSKR